MLGAVLFKQMTPKGALCPDANAVVVAFVLQGARVWLRHKEQLLPSTVSSCDDSSLVLTTDYGKVRRLISINTASDSPTRRSLEPMMISSQETRAPMHSSHSSIITDSSFSSSFSCNLQDCIIRREWP